MKVLIKLPSFIHSPIRRQAIIYINTGLLSIGRLGTNFSDILIKIQDFHLRNASENIVSYYEYAMRGVSVNSTSLYETN